MTSFHLWNTKDILKEFDCFYFFRSFQGATVKIDHAICVLYLGHTDVDEEQSGI